MTVAEGWTSVNARRLTRVDGPGADGYAGAMDPADLYQSLLTIDTRPEPFSVGTAAELWTDPHVARQMLAFHLAPEVSAASRRHDFIDRSARWLADLLPAGGSALDLGCGPGLYTQRLARLGARVTGVDFSASSLAYARAQAEAAALTIDYMQANYLEWDAAERYDLITMIMCDFCVLSPARRSALLERVVDWLRPGGAFVFDAYTLAAYARRTEATTWRHQAADGFWSAGPCFELHATFRYDDAAVTLDKYTLIEPERQRVVHVWHQFFEPDALVAELAEHGLRAEALLGDVAGAPFDADADEFAVIARAG